MIIYPALRPLKEEDSTPSTSRQQLSSLSRKNWMLWRNNIYVDCIS